MSELKSATGTFSTQFSPEAESKSGLYSLGRTGIAKVFAGTLEASSQVTMQSAVLANGAAAYVAIEVVDGRLEGKAGTFLLAHYGHKTETSQELEVKIIPGCSTGELEGLTGTMIISQKDGQHTYELHYTL